MHRRIASWFRKGYPADAPRRGHCYLIALCGLDYRGVDYATAARR